MGEVDFVTSSCIPGQSQHSRFSGPRWFITLEYGNVGMEMSPLLQPPSFLSTLRILTLIKLLLLNRAIKSSSSHGKRLGPWCDL